MSPRPGQLARERNPNWKGGRTVEPRGYVLVKVGKDHPLADVRGYAYEHRLKASAELGRLVTPREAVHHDDETKGNNEPSNLIVTKSKAHHIHEHHGNPRNRHPDEPNPEVSCACGCGTLLRRYDADGRPRVFVSGHNAHPAPTEAAVLRVLDGGPATCSEVAKATGKSSRAVATCLSKLKRKARVEQAPPNRWRIRG